MGWGAVNKIKQTFSKFKLECYHQMYTIKYKFSLSGSDKKATVGGLALSGVHGCKLSGRRDRHITLKERVP